MVHTILDVLIMTLRVTVFVPEALIQQLAARKRVSTTLTMCSFSIYTSTKTTTLGTYRYRYIMESYHYILSHTDSSVDWMLNT